MSAKATFWAWQQSVSALSKLVLLALSNRHNEDTGKCYPSLTKIAADTGLSRISVIRHLAELEKCGLVQPLKYSGRVTHYVLNIGKITIEPVSESNQYQRDTSITEIPPPVSERYGTGIREIPEPKKNLKEESKKDTSKVPYQQIVDLYHECLPDLPAVAKITKTRQGYIRNLWGKDLEDMSSWRNFFEYVADSDFLMGRTEARNGRTPFRADFEWLIKPSNFVKISEEKYHHG